MFASVNTSESGQSLVRIDCVFVVKMLLENRSPSAFIVFHGRLTPSLLSLPLIGSTVTVKPLYGERMGGSGACGTRLRLSAMRARYSARFASRQVISLRRDAAAGDWIVRDVAIAAGLRGH